MSAIEMFKALTVEAIEDLKKVPPPVARISGPLRTGGDGYDTNLKRLRLGEALIRSRGISIFGYEKYSDAIRSAYDLHFEYFHIPILKTGLIQSIFFLPGWEGSGGASYERRLCDELGIAKNDITVEELLAFEKEQRK
jgi:hypothetical protein